ncbi:MAG: DUF308 domain-containing protein [Clostridiales Family XIII bacterium]|jgi:uncharacterized membrane protein HdeD (DUF308 family)|nr:DUF308 domain-containing protein [Clostridiales Family XIII bacterium]
MRILLFVSGIFPIAAGIFFLINEGQTFLALAFVAGLALLALGLIGTLAYFLARRRLGVPGWALADSLLALALSAVTLQNRVPGDDLAPAVFGVWLMASAAMRIAGAVELSQESAGFRRALLILGLMGGAMGAYGFFRPFLPQLGVSGILGGIFILQGVSAVALGAGLSRKRVAGPSKGDAKSLAKTKNTKNATEKTPLND